MTEWLAVLSEDNWEICAKEQLLGFGRRAERRVGEMSEGDRVWIYVNKKFVDRRVPRIRRIRAVVRIAGPLRKLDLVPWRTVGERTFSVARPIHVERALDLDAEGLVRTLSFIPRGPAWGTGLMRSPARLTPGDVAKLDAIAVTAKR